MYSTQILFTHVTEKSEYYCTYLFTMVLSEVLDAFVFKDSHRFSESRCGSDIVLFILCGPWEEAVFRDRKAAVTSLA